MNEYGKFFNNTLIREDLEGGQAPVQASATPAQPSDTDIWKKHNPEIAGNQELSGKFEVEGIPPEVVEQYSVKIKDWRHKLQDLSNENDKGTLDLIYKFAAENAEKDGADSIFNETSKLVEELITGVSTLKGKLSYLGTKINVLISKENKKQRGL